MEYKDILYTEEDGIATITINIVDIATINVIDTIARKA